LSERINAALYEKIQGSLVKWRQLRKLGQGTSGEVFLAQDVHKSNVIAPFFFVVKKLNVFSYNSGID
jgi:serine/threonine protein kinase